MVGAAGPPDRKSKGNGGESHLPCRNIPNDLRSGRFKHPPFKNQENNLKKSMGKHFLRDLCGALSGDPE